MYKDGNDDQKREIMGNVIYKYIIKMVGPVAAPKVTGMMIDVSDEELGKQV